MRRGTITQEIASDVDEHWRTFLDPDIEKDLYIQGLGFKYEPLERRETDAEIFRRIRVVPKLDLPGPVVKVIGSSFAYTEEGTFDKKARLWRARTIPSVLVDRLTSELTVRAEPAGEGKCRRHVEFTLDARIFAVGGLVEGAFEKEIRSGWAKSLEYINARLTKR
jgi:hypothetical protein